MYVFILVYSIKTKRKKTLDKILVQLRHVRRIALQNKVLETLRFIEVFIVTD